MGEAARVGVMGREPLSHISIFLVTKQTPFPWLLLHIYNPSTRQANRRIVELEASSGYITSPCFKTMIAFQKLGGEALPGLSFVSQFHSEEWK